MKLATIFTIFSLLIKSNIRSKDMGNDNRIKGWVSELPDGEGHAVHAVSENNHVVAIKSMRVIILQDGQDTWFAQSMDIDYAASGLSIEDVQKNFEVGLSATIKAHLEEFGNMNQIMRSPNFEDLVSLLLENGKQFEYSTVEVHELTDNIISDNLDYGSISYYEPLKKAA